MAGGHAGLRLNDASAMRLGRTAGGFSPLLNPNGSNQLILVLGGYHPATVTMMTVTTYIVKFYNFSK